MAEDIPVDIGFLEPPEHAWSLWAEYFPSKAGGRPAWLNQRDLPTPDQLHCPYCSKPMAFCLQVYAPLEESADQFHRTIYVFLCTEPNCHTRGSECIRAFRGQLPRENEFFAYDPAPEPPEKQAEIRDVAKYGPVCVVCGCRGPSTCSQCKAVNYCSREHQTLHWKFMGHKTECGGKAGDWGSNESIIWKSILPEFELVVEEEVLEEDGEEEEDDEEQRMDHFRRASEVLNKERAQEGAKSMEEDELPFDEAEVKKDRVFLNFQKRIKKNPDQAIRHVRDVPDGVLWVSEEGKPTDNDIPKCKQCGGERVLEFQILPQILYFLKLDIDWGILGVYTCEKSCSINRPADVPAGQAWSAYVSEFVWRQMHSNIAAYQLPSLGPPMEGVGEGGDD